MSLCVDLLDKSPSAEQGSRKALNVITSKAFCDGYVKFFCTDVVTRYRPEFWTTPTFRDGGVAADNTRIESLVPSEHIPHDQGRRALRPVEHVFESTFGKFSRPVRIIPENIIRIIGQFSEKLPDKHVALPSIGYSRERIG